MNSLDTRIGVALATTVRDTLGGCHIVGSGRVLSESSTARALSDTRSGGNCPSVREGDSHRSVEFGVELADTGGSGEEG